MSERSEQAAIFEWAEIQSGAYPQLSLLFAIPNGQMRRGQPKEPGMKAGIPDMLLPVPSGGYYGLFVELKVGKNKLSRNQSNWINALRAQGYYAVACWGFDEATETILKYLREELEGE